MRKDQKVFFRHVLTLILNPADKRKRNMPTHFTRLKYKLKRFITDDETRVNLCSITSDE